MIPKPYIAKWQKYAPWQEFYQVEQDLVISRVLVELFSDDFLSENLAFRGGTALHKLFLDPPPRYSEDIDLVQTQSGPIKPIMERIGDVITFFEENRSTDKRGHGTKALYRFYSEYEEIKLRLKLEINSWEHFSILGWEEEPLTIENDWYSGSATIRTYNINELLGTKLRALFQRSKGRDLFDLDYARRNLDIDTSKILHCFNEYITFSTGKKPPTSKEFLKNIEAKENDPDFLGDLEGLLRNDIAFNAHEAFAWLKEEVVAKMK